ncbi:MAG: hypothetical protein WC895_02895 [Candidatus Shapirobacteria bacterium]|jgi:hypothetical protein
MKKPVAKKKSTTKKSIPLQPPKITSRRAIDLIRKLHTKKQDTARLRRQVFDRQTEIEVLRKEIRKSGLSFGKCNVQFDLDDEEKLQLLVSVENQRGVASIALTFNQVQLLQDMLNTHI